jgi:hypothetical protein
MPPLIWAPRPLKILLDATAGVHQEILRQQVDYCTPCFYHFVTAVEVFNDDAEQFRAHSK